MEQLFNLIFKENIIFENNYINKNTKGICIRLPNRKNAIILDYKKICNSTEEKCILAEELGHYYCDALYSPLEEDINIICRNEYRAKKWAFRMLIPAETINKSLNRENLSKYEFAEELGVTEEMLEMAYNYYKRNKVI